ncbi:restriction alleviation protein, Lar family [Serratia liquefaciens]|nr:restriction alleviation protein, Lar family [Serratia liquefaciens]
MPANELKPCPFCGGKAVENALGCSEFGGHEHQDYSIHCVSCLAEIWITTGHTGADFPCSCCHDTQKACVEKWNRRTVEAQHG